MSPPKWVINENAFFQKTESMGLGVFASRDISSKEVILCDPVRTFVEHDAEILRKTSAYHILFVDRQTFGMKGKVSPLHLAVGATSIVNHSRIPNCFVEWCLSNEIEESKVKLISNCPIKKGNEFFINYHNISEYDFE